MVTKPTRKKEGQSWNVLDLVLVNDENLISDITHLSPYGKSDHETLLYDIYVSCKDKNITDKHDEKVIYNLKKSNFDKMRQDMSKVDWTALHGTGVEECWQVIKDALHACMEDNIPKMKIKTKLKFRPTWISDEIRAKIRKKNKLYKKWCITKRGTDYQAYQSLRNFCTKSIKKARKAHERNISKKCSSNPKCFWKYVRSKLKVKDGISPLKNKNDVTITDDKGKAELLNDFFSSVFTREDLSSLPKDTDPKNNNTAIVDLIITPQAVKDKLKDLNPNKAQGPDNIPAVVL